MFIPRGKVVYENLATSYVLVDALVDDLSIGGFSGLIEITLRDLDGYILIDRGSVAAVIERHGEKDYSRTTVAELAAHSRRERGRLSIHNYPSGVISAIAGRMTAEPLYTRLSTDFADLEKMISKLSRERDRQWFIDVTTESGAALIHIEDDRCRVIRADEQATDGNTDQLDLNNNAALRGLLDECNRVGSTFDVYFKRATSDEDVERQQISESLPIENVEDAPASEAEDLTAADAVENIAQEVKEAGADDSLPTQVAEVKDQEDWKEFTALSEVLPSTLQAPLTATNSPDVDKVKSQAANKPAQARDALAGETARSSDGEMMVEIKRLMSEITRTIEEAARAIEQRNSFSMYLRTGQLKIADRYPFLDPFGAEFEYLAGEIAFIGKASPADFTEGLTEALKLAVTGVAQSSTQPERLRARIVEDLNRLLERLRPELEPLGLDKSIEQIIG